MMNHTPIAIEISKDKTQIVKGIAILMMIAHHCLIKEFYIEPAPFLSTLWGHKLVSFMKMCVGLFTFFVGYGYFYSSQKQSSYFIQHVMKLLKNYWIVLCFLSIPLDLICANIYKIRYCIDIQDVILNMFGLKHGYCLGNWYVYFYIYSLLILPLVKRFMNSDEIAKTILVIFACSVLNLLIKDTGLVVSAISNSIFYTPILVVGYVCAKTQILTKLGLLVPNYLAWIIICIVTLFCRLYAGGSIFGVCLDTFAVPVVIASIIALLNGSSNNIICKSISKLGDLSIMIWFIHCLFFSDATRRLFQDNSFWPSNLFVIFIGVTVISILVSIPLFKITSKIKFIKK